VHPFGRENDDATYGAHNQSYSLAHHNAEGTSIIFGVFTYSLDEAVTVVGNAEAAGFGDSFVAHIDEATAATVGKVLVIPQSISTPTVRPTQSPTVRSQVPGSLNSCTNGVVMEIRGTARIQSMYDLENPLKRGVKFMDDQEHGLRHCVSEKAGGNTSWCNMLVLNWDMQKFAVFEDELTAHQSGGDDKTFSKYAYIYTFAFSIAVPGQDMHTGNAVFNTMNDGSSQQFISDINYCTSNRQDTDGTMLVPPPYHEGVKLANFNEDMFNEPMVESMNMSSIELTFVAARPTVVPTMRPTYLEQDTDCQLSEWSAWSACDHTCGIKGKARRWRIIIEPASGTGIVCGSPTFETEMTQACNQEVSCPVDCVVSDWLQWSACSVSCGPGKRTRTRNLSEPSAGGAACPSSSEEKDCHEKACPVDCVLSEWSDNGACTKTCGGGITRRYRRIVEAPMYGGVQCADVEPKSATAATTGPLEWQMACNEEECEVDCKVSRWSEWGSCSKNCAGKSAGTRLFGARQARTRFITQAASAGGAPCPVTTQQRLCALHPCGAHVCTTNHGFPLTCTYDNGVVYTHHVNDVHDNELFMCYHNYVNSVCTCLCWQKADLNKSGTEVGIEQISKKQINDDGTEQTGSDASDVSLFGS